VAIDVIDASADFMAGTKRILGVPLLYFFITVLFLAFSLTAFISVHSIGEIEGNNGVFPQYRSCAVASDDD
jgi:succinate-acetate transporter protein